MNNYPTGVIMDAVLEEEVVVADERWEDRADEDEDNEETHDE